MQKLLDGVRDFQDNVFGPQKQMFQQLAYGQEPLALFITCSDSRINPCLLTQTQPGELFILRNAGNIIPPYSASHGGEAATIEYAVVELQVKDIIICGHSHCGAMHGLLKRDSLTKLPAVQEWLRYAEATARIIEENFGDITDISQKVATTVEQNVLVQLDHLRTHPTVAAAVSRGDLRLHGWVYHFETGQVFASVPEQDGKFVPLDKADTKLMLASGRRRHYRVEQAVSS